jgi:CO/xanthine dehydrogenase Mo-binding subunit
LPHWPPAQAHALVLRVTRADRLYTGFDLSTLGAELKPDRVVTAADLARDDLALPEFYGTDMLLPEGKTPAHLGQAVAILIFHDFTRFRFAKSKLQLARSAHRRRSCTPCSMRCRAAADGRAGAQPRHQADWRDAYPVR